MTDGTWGLRPNDKINQHNMTRDSDDRQENILIDTRPRKVQQYVIKIGHVYQRLKKILTNTLTKYRENGRKDVYQTRDRHNVDNNQGDT